MTPEELTASLQAALPSDLRAVVLYGSAAAGDHVPGSSDCNVLVVVESLSKATLDALAAPVRAWTRGGQRPPLVFTQQQLVASADAFPIEITDIQKCRRILFGEDPLAGVQVALANYRLELERELKARLLQLREDYLLAAGKPRRVLELLVESLSAFLVLFRAALRLYQDEAPMAKLDALRALAGHLGLDPQAFLTIQALREGKLKARDVSPPALFEKYLASIEAIADAVDRHMHKE